MEAKKIIELRQKRAGVIEQGGAILDKAESEGRDLTAEESSKYDSLLAEAEGINSRIRRAENQSDVERVLKESAGRQADLQMGGSSGAARPGELRFLTNKEQLSQVYPPRNDEWRRIDLGKMVLLASGVNVPNADLERRALSSSSDVAGGFAVPDDISRVIFDMARQKAVVMKAGAITVEMPGQNFRIPKMTKDPTGTWKAELAEAPDTGCEFAAVEMRARTLMFWIEVSRELAEDSVGLDAAVRNAMAQSAALEIDRAALFGIGAGEQPMGLYCDADVTKAAVTPGAYWDDISLSMRAIENGNLTPTAVLMSPRTHHILRVLRDGEGRFQAFPAWSPPVLVSKQISDTLGAGSNQSIVVTGDFSNLIIGVRSAYHLEVLKEASAKKYAIVLLAAVRMDTAIVRGEGFHILTGLTTSWG